MKKLEWDELTPEQQNGFIALIEGLNDGKFPEPKQPEKWTVERVIDEVKPSWICYTDGNIVKTKGAIIGYQHGKGLQPTEQDAKKVLAFCQLLTCAHWANEGQSFTPSEGNRGIAPYYNSKGKAFHQSSTEIGISHPFYLKSEKAFDKFLSIEGIKPLLKTFFGINQPT